MRAKYYPGAGGRRYFYDSDPVVRCPFDNEETRRAFAGYVAAATDEYHRSHGSPPDVEALLRKAHPPRTSRRAHPERPGRCPLCDAELETAGYETWIDRPERTAQRMGLMAWERSDRKVWPTKREAIQWAREEAAIDKAAAREEARA